MRCMTKIWFDIPYPPTKAGKTAWNRRFGLNAYYAGKPWPARKRDAQELHAITWAALKRAKIKKEPLKVPVKLKFLFDDGLDCSNHAVIVKAVEDAMKGWVIEDDSRKYVKSITTMFHQENCIRVIVQEAR